MLICSHFCIQFFDMNKYDAVKALDIYKRAAQQVNIYVFQ